MSVGTVHEDVNAELLAVRDRTGSKTENYRDLEMMRMDTGLRMLHPVMTGPDHALRVQATRVWVQISVQRSRLLGRRPPLARRRRQLRVAMMILLEPLGGVFRSKSDAFTLNTHEG